MSTISEKKFVAVSYDLYVGGENEELMEQATAEHPLTFYYGVGMMLPKFEENLSGLKEGDTFDFKINHEDAYGEYDDNHLVDLDKSVFEIEGKFDEEYIKPGAVVPLMDSEGNKLNAAVVEVGDKVKVDLNHPLAGEDLHFIGKILEIKEVSEEEIEKMLHSCGSDCGEGCDSCGCGCH